MLKLVSFAWLIDCKGITEKSNLYFMSMTISWVRTVSMLLTENFRRSVLPTKK